MVTLSWLPVTIQKLYIIWFVKVLKYIIYICTLNIIEIKYDFDNELKWNLRFVFKIVMQVHVRTNLKFMRNVTRHTSDEIPHHKVPIFEDIFILTKFYISLTSWHEEAVGIEEFESEQSEDTFDTERTAVHEVAVEQLRARASRKLKVTQVTLYSFCKLIKICS